VKVKPNGQSKIFSACPLGQEVTGTAIQQTSGFLLIYAAPLLEEKGHTLPLAMITHGAQPLLGHGPGVTTRLTAHNHQIYST